MPTTPAPGFLANASTTDCACASACALGVKTSLQDLASLGWQPIALLVGETLFLAAFVLGGIQVGGL